MNSLTTTLHLLRHDLRRFRIFWAAYALLHIVMVLVGRAPLPRGVGELIPDLLRTVEIAGFGVLVAQVFIADSAVDSRSGWWTRPVGIRNLLAAKVAYVLTALWLPLMAVYLVDWWIDGFSARQLLFAAAELSIYALAVAALVGGIAAAAGSFVATVAGLGFLAVGLMAARWLAVATRWRDELIEGSRWVVGGSGIVLLPLLAMLCCGAVCLVAVYLLRRRALVVAGLALVALTPFWLPGKDDGREVETLGHPSIELVAPAAGAAKASLMIGNIAVRGLPEHHVAVPVGARFWFADAAGRRVHFDMRQRDPYARSHIGHEVYSLPLISQFLPPGVSLRPARRGFSPEAMNTHVTAAQGIDISQPGRLAGELDYQLFELVSLGRLELRLGARLKHGGHTLELVGFDDAEEQLSMDLRTTWPRLIASHDPDDGITEDRQPRSFWLLAMVFPQAGFAQLAYPSSNSIGGPFPVSARSFQRVHFTKAGIVMGGAGKPEIFAFRMVDKGRYKDEFEWSDHLVNTAVGEPALALEDDGAGGGAGAEPDSVAALDRRYRFGRQIPYLEQEALQSSAARLFAAELEGALARAPWRSELHVVLEKVLADSATPVPLPALREALRRDPRLISVVEKRGWGAQFDEYVRAELARRNPRLEPALVRLAIRYSDPTLFEELHWQFVHNRRVQRSEIYQALQALPGFDARSALEAAWGRSRVVGGGGDLWLVALEGGLPGALRHAVDLLYAEGIADSDNRSGLLQNLMRLTGFTGGREAFYTWIEDNADRLRFDGASGRYTLD